MMKISKLRIIVELTVAAVLAVSSLQRPRGRVRERVRNGV